MTQPVVRPVPLLGYTCHTCHNTSVHPDDVKDCYCGHCRRRHTGDLVVTNWSDPWDDGNRPVLKPPRIGCSMVSHARLGWCAQCPKILPTAEVLAWRLHAMRAIIPGHTGAVRFSEQAR